MPVSLEQQRAAVGAMAKTAVTIARMIVSGAKQVIKKVKETPREGLERVCELDIGTPEVLVMKLRQRAVFVSSVLMILVLQLHSYDTSGGLGDCRMSEGTRIVFVNQMLLMIAGDVEPNPGPVTLSSDDLAVLVSELHDVREEWYHIGLQLNVKSSDLNCIRIQCMNNLKDCLTEMLTKWLTLVEPSPPSWQRVVDALSSPDVDRLDVAQHIMHTYCSTQESVNDIIVKSKGPLFHTIGKIQTEMELLENEFEALKDDVYCSVESQPVGLFKVKLTSFKVRDKECHLEFIKKVVHNKCSVTDIWIELNEYFNFLNHTILQHILNKFKNRDLQIRMDKYKDKLHAFLRRTRVCDFVQCWPMEERDPPERELREFVVKSKKNWDTCTMDDLENLKGKLATKLLLPEFALKLKSISKGCVEVSYFISFHLVDNLQTIAREIHPEEIAKMEIERITVDGIVCCKNPVIQYTTVLKQLYTSRNPLQPLSESKSRDLLPFRLARIEKEIISSSDMDRFTRETLRGDMDDVVYKKTAMELWELGVMKDGSLPQVVLIEGAPGVGKTTFAWEQCRQWAEGNVLGDYFIVLLLPLRDNNIRQIRSLPDLFQHSRGQVREEVCRAVTDSGGKGCLIWLEAWDELPSNFQASDSFFSQLIQGIQLPAATIFITSRPWATRDLLEKVGKRLSQRIELLALAKEEVKNEIKAVVVAITSDTRSNSGFDFSQFLESYPVIRAAMYTPVSAAIVEQVFRSAPHNPPTTVTQLYSAYVLMRLEQHLSQHTKYSHMKIKVRTLTDLPEEVMGDLQVLCHLAYEGVSHQMIMFSSLPEGVSTLGLLQTVPQVYDEGEDRVSYNFLHYTVQEYLAALHLSYLDPEELRAITKIHYRQKTTVQYGTSFSDAAQFKMTLLFLAGITGLKQFPVHYLSSLLRRDTLTKCRWLCESQNQACLEETFGVGGNYLTLPYTASLTDYYAVGYCLAHSNCTWGFDFGAVDDNAMEYFRKGCNDTIPTLGRILTVVLTRGLLTSDGLREFLTLPDSIIHSVANINISSNFLGKTACDLIAKNVKRMPVLEKLNLSFNRNIGPGGCVELLSSLHNQLILKELNLSAVGMDETDFECLGSLIDSTSTLKSLIIGWNTLSSRSMDTLCKALNNNQTITRFDMVNVYLTHYHSVSVGKILSNPQCPLEMLDVSECHLIDETVGNITNAVRENGTLKELILNRNQFGFEGITAIGTMLQINTSLDRLCICSCGIDSSGGVLLGKALEKNKTLKVLELSDNQIGCVGARGLCNRLENNSSLLEVWLDKDQSIGHVGVSMLLDIVDKKQCGLNKIMLPEEFQRDISYLGSLGNCDIMFI